MAIPSGPPGAAPPAASAASAAIDSDGGATKMAQLQQLQQTLQALEIRLKADHPDVIRTKRLIADLEKSIGRSRPASSSASAPPIDPAAAARSARIDQIRAQIANVDKEMSRKTGEQDKLKQLMAIYRARLESEPARESEMIELTRAYDTVKETYRSLLAKKEESGIAANLERQQVSQQFRTLDPARLPEKPYGPNRSLINMIGAGAGFALGLGFTLLLELRDQTFRTSLEVVPVLSLPVLASVPIVITAWERRRAKRLAMSFAIILLSTIIGGGVYAVKIGFINFKIW